MEHVAGCGIYRVIVNICYFKCVCIDLWLEGVVCQFSELPQLWLVLPHDILDLYPWRLWQYFPIVFEVYHKAQYC